MKAEGWKRVKSQNISQAMIGYGLIAYGHFYRSEESCISNNKKHSRFTEYFQHWLYSDENFIPKRLMESFKKLYSKPRNVHIACGKSYWGTGKQST